MECATDSIETQEATHFLEVPLRELLDKGPVLLGQNEDLIAARNEAAFLLQGLDAETQTALTEHPLIGFIAENLERESTKDGYDLARNGWRAALTFVSAAMTVEDDGVKNALGLLHKKYVKEA